MMVVCINNKSWERLSLTLGKVYTVIKEVHVPFSPQRYDDPTGPFYLIKSDDGKERHFEKDRFRELTVAEKRDLKIDSLLWEKRTA